MRALLSLLAILALALPTSAQMQREQNTIPLENVNFDDTGTYTKTSGSGITWDFSAAAGFTVGALTQNGDLTLGAGYDLTTTAGDGELNLNFTVTNASATLFDIAPVYTGGATDTLTYSLFDVAAFAPTNAAGTDTVSYFTFGAFTDPGAGITSEFMTLPSGLDNGINFNAMTALNLGSAGTDFTTTTNLIGTTAGIDVTIGNATGILDLLSDDFSLATDDIDISDAGAITGATGVSTSGVLDANGTVDIDTSATAGLVASITTQDVGGAGQTTAPILVTIANNSVEAQGFPGVQIVDNRAGTESSGAVGEAALRIDSLGDYGLSVTNGAVDFADGFSVSGGAVDFPAGSVARADLAEDALQTFNLPMTLARKSAGAAMVDETKADAEWALVFAGWSTGTLTAVTNDTQNTTKTSTCGWEFTLPPSYVAAADCQLIVTANHEAVAGGTTISGTVEFEAYEIASDGTVSANLVVGGSQATSPAAADKTFTVTATALVPGDRLIILLRGTCTEGGNSGTAQTEIGAVVVKIDIKG